MTSFAGRVAFVTGAASGIGRITAVAFACEVPMSWSPTSTNSSRDTARIIEDLGGQALAVSCDVTSSDDVYRHRK